MKELVLHFGIHRTGTTTTQAVLKKNKGILRSHGVLYPSLFTLPDHVKIPWWIKNGKTTIDEVVASIQKQEEEFISKIVLSAEDFCMLDDFSFLDAFQEHYNVTIVLYLKEQSAWLESWYNQHVKWPWTRKFSSCEPSFFVDNISDFHWIDYQSLLGKITKHIEPSRLSVETVGSHGVLDTTAHIMEKIGLSVDRLHPYTHANESLTTGALEVIRRLDLMGVPAPARSKIITAVGDIDIPGDFNKAVFTDNQRQDIYQGFLDSNNTVAREWFGRESLFGEFSPRNIEPLVLSDEEVYGKYIPELCKIIASKG